MNKHEVKHHRNSDTKAANRDHIRTTALERSVMNYWGLKLVLRAQPHPPQLMWYKHLVGCSVRVTRQRIFTVNKLIKVDNYEEAKPRTRQIQCAA